MEVTQHARYTCTFCGKVRSESLISFHFAQSFVLLCDTDWAGSSYRTLSSEPLLEFGTAVHAVKPLLEVHGLFRRRLLLPFAGT